MAVVRIKVKVRQIQQVGKIEVRQVSGIEVRHTKANTSFEVTVKRNQNGKTMGEFYPHNDAGCNLNKSLFT